MHDEEVAAACQTADRLVVNGFLFSVDANRFIAEAERSDVLR